MKTGKAAVFVKPYKKRYTLIGTTEKEVSSPDNPIIDDEEIDYLINSVNKFFINQLKRNEIIETFSGIRPLIEDFKEASKVTRDYIFDLNVTNINTPLLNIYGGKLTTYRKLAEKVLSSLRPYINKKKINSWTSSEKL